MENFEINLNQIDKIKNLSIEERSFRIKNLELFKNAGFPNKQLEDWKFSDFRSIVNSNFKELDTKTSITTESKLNLLNDFKHNHILLVNGNLHSSNFSHEEEKKIKIKPYDKNINYTLSKNHVILRSVTNHL